MDFHKKFIVIWYTYSYAVSLRADSATRESGPPSPLSVYPTALTEEFNEK